MKPRFIKIFVILLSLLPGSSVSTASDEESASITSMLAALETPSAESVTNAASRSIQEIIVSHKDELRIAFRGADKANRLTYTTTPLVIYRWSTLMHSLI